MVLPASDGGGESSSRVCCATPSSAVTCVGIGGGGGAVGVERRWCVQQQPSVLPEEVGEVVLYM